MFSELKQPNRVQLNIFTIPEDREASKMVFFAFPIIPPSTVGNMTNNGGQRSEKSENYLWQELSTWHGVELETDLTVWGSQTPLAVFRRCTPLMSFRSGGSSARALRHELGSTCRLCEVGEMSFHEFWASVISGFLSKIG